MSTMITKLAIWAGLAQRNDLSDEPVQTNGYTYSRSPESSAVKKNKAPKFGQFQSVFDALQLGMERFAVHELQGHRAIDPSLICKVTLIEIQPLHEDAVGPIRAMLAIHKPERIAGFIQRDILDTLTNGRFFDFSAFGGLAPLPLEKRFDACNQEDPLLADFGQTNRTAGDYELSIHWEATEAASAARPSTFARAETNHPTPTEDAWQLQDDGGQQSIKLPLRGAAEALIIGKDKDAAIAVSGTFISSRHGALWFDQGNWWYQDQNSSNGSRVCHTIDSDAVFPACADKSIPLPKEVAVFPGAKIYFSKIIEGDTPFLELLATSDGKKPTAPKIVHAGTPVQKPPTTHSASAAQSFLARLQVEDAEGHRVQNVPANALPFEIGRSSSAHLIIPGQNHQLSREHLQITAIESNGARINVLGDEGAQLGTTKIAKGQQAFWPWGQTLQLGNPDDQVPLLNLTLLQAT